MGRPDRDVLEEVMNDPSPGQRLGIVIAEVRALRAELGLHALADKIAEAVIEDMRRELAESNHWREKWCTDYHAAVKQAQDTLEERKQLRAELAESRSQLELFRDAGEAAELRVVALRGELADLREQLARALRGQL